MGEGMRAHILSVDSGINSLAITTDGIHFIEAPVLERVLLHSPDLKSASERLSALARWCGGPDNASSAMVDLQVLLEQIKNEIESGIEVWDSSGSVIPMWIEKDVQNSVDVANPGAGPLQGNLAEGTRPALDEPKQASKAKRSKKTKAKKQLVPKDDIQLEIQIDRSPHSDEVDENS
jgi:hypothetical protein